MIMIDPRWGWSSPGDLEGGSLGGASGRGPHKVDVGMGKLYSVPREYYRS